MQRKLSPCFDDPVAHGLTASHHGARALASYHIEPPPFASTEEAEGSLPSLTYFSNSV